LLGSPKTMKFSDLQEIFMTVFEFIGQFFFQNDVVKLQEVFSEHEICRVFIENGLGSFQSFLFYRFETNQRR
jgi:hypothetical protein